MPKSFRKRLALGALVLPTAWSVLALSFSLSTFAEPAPEEYRGIISSAIVQAVAVPGIPDQPQVTKITLQGEYGLADWTMGDAGGTVALIARRGNTWSVIRLGGGMPTASDLSQATEMPITVAQNLLNEHMGGEQVQSVPSYCQEGEQTFLAVETTSYWISICGESEPTTYVGVAKNDPQQSIRLPLQDYNLTSPQFVATHGSITYIVGNSAQGNTLTVSSNDQELLREPILRGL